MSGWLFYHLDNRGLYTGMINLVQLFTNANKTLSDTNTRWFNGVLYLAMDLTGSSKPNTQSRVHPKNLINILRNNMLEICGSIYTYVCIYMYVYISVR